MELELVLGPVGIAVGYLKSKGLFRDLTFPSPALCLTTPQVIPVKYRKIFYAGYLHARPPSHFWRAPAMPKRKYPPDENFWPFFGLFDEPLPPLARKLLREAEKERRARKISPYSPLSPLSPVSQAGEPGGEPDSPTSPGREARGPAGGSPRQPRES